MGEGELLGYLRPKNGKGSIKLQIRKKNKIYNSLLLIDKKYIDSNNIKS